MFTSLKYHLELKQKESWSRPLIFHQKNPIPGCQPGTLSAWGSLHGFAEPQMRDSEPQRGTWTGLKLRGLLQDGVPQGTHISKRLGVLLRAAWQVPSWDLVFLKSQISLQHWDRQRLLSEGCYLVMEVPQTQWRGPHCWACFVILGWGDAFSGSIILPLCLWWRETEHPSAHHMSHWDFMRQVCDCVAEN